MAERELGLESWCVAYRPDPFGAGYDELLFDREETSIKNERRRWMLLLRAIRNYDVVHYNAGTTIFPMTPPAAAAPAGLARTALRIANKQYSSLLEQRDLPLLKRLGKAIFVSYQGRDARQLDYCRAHFEVTHAHDMPPEDEEDNARRARIDMFARYADGMYALNPDLLHVLPRNARFLPYAHISLTEWKPIGIKSSDRPLVVHAPSDRTVKGTRFVLQAVERLKSEGIDFDFQLVEGLPIGEARKLYERADILIDQLLLGWYGGVAAEFMALAKPVISYIRETDLVFVPNEMREQLPVVNASPSTIYSVLRDALTHRRRELADIGARSRAYMERWHDPRVIAATLKADYERAVNSGGSRHQA
jgi:hypothetical protein